MAKVKILNEVPIRNKKDDTWTLHFQKCVYHYDDGRKDDGYRFIWRRPNGSLQAARGQARLPDKKAILDLLAQATEAGWF